MSSNSANSKYNFNDFLKMVDNPDGTITRVLNLPIAPATPHDDDPNAVLSKDITINAKNNTWARVYLPPQARTKTTSKLPIIVYYHGGGFVICSAATAIFHTFCAELASHVPAIIVSVEYRLAPEHRLPAAYDDAVEALDWIKNSDDTWIKERADLSNCFLMGSSAGGNIAYYAGVRVAESSVENLSPLKIKGFILHHPFFGSVQRPGSETRLANDGVLPLCATDLMWELGLPKGADRDHEYCNAMEGKGLEKCDKIRELGWRFLVNGCDGDLLNDHQLAFAEMLESKGVSVKTDFVEGGCHVVEFVESSKAKKMYGLVKEFISA